MIAVGPYVFTDTDAERTLKLTATFFDLLPGGWPPDPHGVAAPFRAEALAAADEGDLATVWDRWRGAMAALRAAGTYGLNQTGEVVGLFRGDGGVPKVGVDALEVTWAGVRGDRQADRANHGRPWQALCLWSAEVIGEFAAAGHALAPGRAGENLTLSGLDWPRVVPGAQLRVGEVLAEISSYAVPCSKNAQWFVDGRFDAMHHRHGPVSRVYATVIEPGTIRLGDAATLEPSAVTEV